MMFGDIKIILGAAAASFLLACVLTPLLPKDSDLEVNPAIKLVSLDAFKSEFAHREDLLILDVRASLWYDLAHIPGAVHFPEAEWRGQRLKNLSQTSASLIVVYCSNAACDDSNKVAQLFIDQGARNVAVLVSGWEGWVERFPNLKEGDAHAN